MQRTSPKTKVAVDLDQVLGSFIFKLSVGIVMVLGAVPLCCQLAVDFDHSDKQYYCIWFLAGVICEFIWGMTTVVLCTRPEQLEAHRRPVTIELVIENTIEVTCSICLQRPKSVLLLPCRHLCLCPQCSAHLPEAVCPLCRCGVQQRIETFI